MPQAHPSSHASKLGTSDYVGVDHDCDADNDAHDYDDDDDDDDVNAVNS